MELILLVGLLFFFLLIGVPVAFALGAASFATFLALDIPAVVAVQRMTAGVSVFTLMAIPFFVFAGDLMHRSGIAERLVRLADAAFGRARGGLGQVDVGASMLFGAVSGSAVAGVSAIGSTLAPMMLEKGYDRDYIVNVTSTAAITGLLIPPSHNMILYAASAGEGVSVGDLFLAGVAPGILTGVLLMIVAWLVAVRRGYPRGVFPGWASLLRSAAGAAPGLLTAIIIVVGILSGVCTPTESSAVAVVYTLAVALFVYRSLSAKAFALAVTGAVRTTSMVMLIIGSAAAFGWLLAYLQGPSKLAELLLSLTENPIALLLLINLILLLLGTFMDMAPLIIITTPIFLPIVKSLGVDPVQFGVMMMLNLGIGLVTPPVGSVLFVGCAVGGLSIEKTIRTIWPFYLALVAALAAVTFVPALSLALPELLK
jgi:tripartite ATP-independent transporter DctM subunit